MEGEDIEKAVEKMMMKYFNELENNAFTIFKRALNNNTEIEIVSHSVINEDIIKQLDSLVKSIQTKLDESDKEKLHLLQSVDEKFQLFVRFKAEEFNKLRMLVYNNIEEENSSKMTEVSTEEKYLDQCHSKIKSIFREINVLEKRYGHKTELVQNVLATVIGLENYSTENLMRHEYYDKLLERLLACINSPDSELEKIENEVFKIRKNVFYEQWNKFAERKLNKKTMKCAKEILIEIIDAYSKNDDFEEIIYYISNLTQLKCIEDVYSIVKQKSKTMDADLYEFLLNLADQNELSKIFQTFQSRVEKQIELYKQVVDLKIAISDEYDM